MLEILARHPGQVFSRGHLLDCVWPRDYNGDERISTSASLGSSRRIGDATIQTVYRVGYKLAVPYASLAA